jgi:cytochrome b
MKATKVRVYDWPTRLFHWSFAGLFVSAFFIAKTIDDESPTYSYHMLLGLLLAATAFLRIIWGVIGSKYARFSSFALRPSELLGYFRDLLLGRGERRLGHNPASSWAALVMLSLALGLGITGFLMTTGGDKEVLEEIHELFANAFLVVVIAHVAGVLLHMIRYRDGIGFSMVHGKKSPVDREPGIARSHTGAGLIYVAIMAVFALHLSKNYDAGSQSLNLFGNKLQLGESGEEHEDGDDD